MTAPQRKRSYFETWNDARFSEGQQIYRVVSLISRGLISGDVLDLGCGSRVYYDTTNVERWVGVDLSALLLDEIRFLSGTPPAGPVETMQRSCVDLPFEVATFDCVCAVFLLHHLGRGSRRRSRVVVAEVLRGARRVLKSEGTMLIIETWPRRLMHLYHLAYPVADPLARRLAGVELPYFFSPRAYRAMADEAGFAECHVLPVDLYEAVRQPVLGFVLPAWAQRLFQTYTIYILKA